MKRVPCIATAAAGGLLMLGLAARPAPALADPPPVNDALPMPSDLAPRIAVEKEVWVSRPRGVDSRMAVKFRDGARVRLENGSLRAGIGIDTTELNQVISAFDLSFQPMFEQSAADLERVRVRAATASGRAQPDLQAMMFVEGGGEFLEDAANALNALGIVEYVEFVPDVVLHGAGNTTYAAAANAIGTLAGDREPTPNFVPIEDFIRFFDDVNGDGEWDPDGEDDLFDTPDDEIFIGGLDVPEAWDVGQFIIDRGLTVRGWRSKHNGGRGATINVGVVELAAFIKHEELKKQVKMEPDQRMLPVRIAGRAAYNHGTATLGQLVARDSGLPGADRRNPGDGKEKGIVGIVPEARGWFFPTSTRQNPGGRLMSAIASALMLFNRGDVLSFSIGFDTVGPLITSDSIAVLMRQASDLGIVTVMSAGNDCRNLDDVNWPNFDTGSIVVGAGMPLGSPNGLDPYSRTGFSNHYSEPDEDLDSLDRRVHTQAWGAEVVTLGFGDLFDPGSRKREYTSQFSGTSSAAPMVAGAAAAVQGIAKSFFGTPLTPEQVRGLIAGNVLCQEGLCLGIEDQISGTEDFPQGNPCNPAEFDPEEDPDIVGGFPNMPEVLSALFTTGFFDDSFLTRAKVIRGNHEFGSVNNLKVFDGNPFIVTSEMTTAGAHSAPRPFPNPVYFITGQVTDVGVVARIPDPDDITAMTVTAILSTTVTSGRTVGIEMYNHVSNRWDVLTQTGTDLDPLRLDVEVATPENYLNDERLKIRVWTGVTGTSEPHAAFYDLIQVDVNNGGFGGGPGDG